MLIADGRCQVCLSDPVYSLVGKCSNCAIDDVLMVFTEKHSKLALPCPACGCKELKSHRPATIDEVTAVLSGV